MHRYAPVMRQVDQLEEVAGDRCGKTVNPHEADEPTDGQFEYQEMLKVRHQCGYGSRIGAGDQCIIETDLCQNCWWELLGPYCRVSTRVEFG